MTIASARRSATPDVLVIVLYLLIVGIGWAMIVSATLNVNEAVTLSLAKPYGRQLMFIVIGLVAMAICLLLPYQFWRNFSLVFYLLAIVLLIAVLLFGSEVKGATSWFSIGSFGFQPSEYAKLAVALAVTAYTASPSFKLSNYRSVVVCLGLVAIPASLILLQPDAGSALVFASIALLLYRLGMWSGFYIVLLSVVVIVISTVAVGTLPTLSAVLAFILVVALIVRYRWKNMLTPILIISLIVITWVLGYLYFDAIYLCYVFAALLSAQLISILWQRAFRPLAAALAATLIAVGIVYSTDVLLNDVLEPHQRERIYVWLQPDKCDPRGSLYNVVQSKVAIGSGGWFGKGYRRGTMTNLNYVPEQQTDFIFCTLGEEFGFVGVVVFVLLYGGFILRILVLAEQSRKAFTRNYGYIIVGYLLTHFIINIGMTMGLAPIIGIPLPYVSYGGSSLIIFSMMIGVFLRLRMDDR